MTNQNVGVRRIPKSDKTLAVISKHNLVHSRRLLTKINITRHATVRKIISNNFTMSTTPNSISNDEKQAAFSYHAFAGDNPLYGSYFLHAAEASQPRNLPHTSMAMGSDNAVASTSSSMNYNIVPERAPTSSLFNPSTNQTICANSSTKWREEQSSILVQEWKERIEEVESSRATETWRQILDVVNKAGIPKTVKHC